MQIQSGDFYVIRVQGHLDQTLSSILLDMSISLDEDGTTLLAGEVADQSALLGCLLRLNSLGAKVLYLEMKPDVAMKGAG